MAEPNPTEVSPWYLRNINQALALDEASGNVYLRTGIDGDIIITGNVNIPGSVEISNDVGNPVPVTGTVAISTVTGEVTVVPSGATSTTAWNEPLGITIYPVVQQDAIYGLDSDKTRAYIAGTGNVAGANSTIVLSTGINQYSYATAQTVRGIRYRPGQGALARFTAYFANPTTGYTQRAGFGSLENAIQIGYNGDANNFGVLRASGGLASIYRLTVTNPATGAGSTVTITLNGTAFVIAVPSGTVEENAAYIGQQTFTGWNAEEQNAQVTFQRQSLGSTPGAFSVSGTGTFTATLTELQIGTSQTENWTYQEDFNIDKLNGTGPSGMDIDPSKLNVYQINFRWLGAGEIRYAIEDAAGNMVFFHREYYSNQYTTPHLLNPTMKIQYVAASLGGTGANVVTGGSSLMGATEGEIVLTNYPNAVGTSLSGGFAQNTYQHMLSLRNNQVFNGKINQREIIVKRLSAAANSASSSPIQVYIYKNIQTTEPREWSGIGPGSFSAYSQQDTEVAHTTSRVIFQMVVQPGGSVETDLGDLRIILAPSETLAVGMFATNTVQNAAVTLTWYED